MKFQNSCIHGSKVMLCIKKRDERTDSINAQKGINAQNYKGPQLMKYFSEFLQKLIRSSTQHYKSIY